MAEAMETLVYRDMAYEEEIDSPPLPECLLGLDWRLVQRRQERLGQVNLVPRRVGLDDRAWEKCQLAAGPSRRVGDCGAHC